MAGANGYRTSKERFTKDRAGYEKYDASCEDAEEVIAKTLKICQSTNKSEAAINDTLKKAHILNIQLVRLAIPKMVLKADIDRAHNTIAHLQGLIAATEPA